MNVKPTMSTQNVITRTMIYRIVNYHLDNVQLELMSSS